MSGIIGRKIGMTSIFTENGDSVACTVIEAGPCAVTQVKTVETDGYAAVQLAFGDKREKNTTKPLLGHFKKANTTPKRKIAEFKDFIINVSLGDVVKAEDVCETGEFVDIVGTSKGKGFQGVVKRHGFSGVGGATHGQHNRQRHPGSIGACSFPARVFKGLRMAGRTGGNRVTVQNLRILKVISDRSLILVSGAVPGAKNSFVLIDNHREIM